MKFKLSRKTLYFSFFTVYIICLIVLQFIVNDEAAYQVDLSNSFEPMSMNHLLGTDDYGRDLFSRLVVGSRATLFVTLLTLLFTVVVGVPLGLLAGYKRLD